MAYTFFATVSRMKYINRWALMRNSREEDLSEHSLEVAMIAHALCTIGNVRYGRHLDAEKAALVGLYHDASEIITGDMPTPVKYYNSTIRDAYKDVERTAEQHLLDKLPADLRGEYEKILCDPTAGRPSDDRVSEKASSENERSRQNSTETDDESFQNERYMRRLVKAADKLSALIKCIEERNSGNQEFRSAEESTRNAIAKMAEELPEINDFLEEFLPAYGKTLDELSGPTC